MHQIGPSQSVVVAGRALALQCFATMASIAGQLHSVELLDLVPGQTRANKLAVPANAVVKWTSGRTDARAVSPLASGAGRDVVELFFSQAACKLPSRSRCQVGAGQAFAEQYALITPAAIARHRRTAPAAHALLALQCVRQAKPFARSANYVGALTRHHTHAPSCSRRQAPLANPSEYLPASSAAYQHHLVSASTQPGTEPLPVRELDSYFRL